MKKIIIAGLMCMGSAVCAAQTLTVCASASYTIPSAEGVPDATYEWWENGVKVSGTGAAYTNTAGKSAAGTYVYVRRAYTAACGWQNSNTFFVYVTGSDTPVITASADAVCRNTALTFYVASPVAGAVYTWTASAGTANGSSYTFDTSTDGAKTATVYASTADGMTCQSANAATKTATVNAFPAVPTGASANARCGSGTVTFSATVPSGITIDWYTASSGGSLVSGGNGVTSFAPTLTTTTTYYAQARNTTTQCVSATRLAVTTTVNAVPAAPTGASANSRCGAGTVTFSATAPSGCTIDWYTASSGGSLVSGGNGVTSFAPTLTTTTTYYAQARNTTTQCVSATRLAVTGTVNAVPAVPTGASANARCGSGTVTFSATVPSGITIDWYTASSGGSLVSGGSGVVSFAPTLTTTTTYYAQARNTTTQCVSATRLAVSATINTTPSAPYDASSYSRCDPGTVTFSATVTSGRTIDWYTAASGGSLVSGGNGVTSFAPTLTTTTTYYAQARITSTQCVSATRLAVTGTVKTRPTITLTSGNASQTVKQYSAITPTTYAADATVLRGGILPNGVTDSGASASSITISGTPTEAGTYNYSILAIGSNSCPNAMNGTLTVIPVFYSSSTWSFGGVTWSDVLVVQPPYCTQVTTLTSYQNATPPAEYVIKTVDGTDYYYYNWPCVLTLCDSPWHMPSEAHYLFAFFAPANNPIVGQWGTAGHASGNRVYGYGYFGAYATCSPGTGPDRQTNVANYADDSWVSGDEYRANAHQVRCIKD